MAKTSGGNRTSRIIRTVKTNRASLTSEQIRINNLVDKTLVLSEKLMNQYKEEDRKRIQWYKNEIDSLSKIKDISSRLDQLDKINNQNENKINQLSNWYDRQLKLLKDDFDKKERKIKRKNK